MGTLNARKEDQDPLAVVYKIDVLETLKEKGYTTHKLRQNYLLPEGVIQQLRHNELVSWRNIEKLCALLECEIGDIITIDKDIAAANIAARDERIKQKKKEKDS